MDFLNIGKKQGARSKSPMPSICVRNGLRAVVAQTLTPEMMRRNYSDGVASQETGKDYLLLLTHDTTSKLVHIS